MGLGKLRSTVVDRMGALSKPFQLLLVVIACGLAGLFLLWLFNEAFYYYLARTYVEQIADAYDLNRHLANAIVWVSFAAITILAGFTLSLSKQKRTLGTIGILVLLTGHSLVIWHGVKDDNFDRKGHASRCYVLTRDNFKILNREGVDPETGRECRPLTPQVVEKLQQYRTGKRPVLIDGGDPTFFDPLSGEPVLWYAKSTTGDIELYDLMGFHPRTGIELLPIDRKIAEEWRAQAAVKIRRAPNRVDPNKYPPFDPVTGRAKMWFWRDGSEQYEFYDGPGFEPRTGDPLTVVSREILVEWQRDIEAAAAKKKQEQDLRDKEQREKTERELREKQEAVERDRAAKEAEAEAQRKRLQSANDCDRLAANPTDQRKAAEGVAFDVLKLQADQALDACTAASQQFPSEPRYRYQLGRAAYFKDRKKAFDLFTSLTAEGYAAAFDNLGTIYLYDRKDIAGAIRLFTKGASLGDADSMVSLSDLVDKGYYTPPDPMAVKWSLLKQAAEHGHMGAQKAIAKQMEQEEVQRQAGQVAGEIFRNILQGTRH